MFFFSLQIMCSLGNARVNGIYEYEIPSHVKKPNPQSSRYSFYNREGNKDLTSKFTIQITAGDIHPGQICPTCIRPPAPKL